jgi:serine protease Do
MNLSVSLGRRPASLAAAPPGQPLTEGPLQGIAVENLSRDMRDQLDLPAGTQGVVITNIAPDSPAAQEGLQPGDMIQAIGREHVRNVADFARLAARAKNEVLLRIIRQGAGMYVVISPPPE